MTAAPFAPVATASSGLPVMLEIVSSGGVATFSGGTVTLSGATGSVTVKARQPGNGTYSPAPAEFSVPTTGQKRVFIQLQVTAP